MTTAVSEYAALVQQYSNAGRHVEQSIQHLSLDDLKMVPVPGKWSIQQVVLHLCDAELAFADRIKRLIATEKPTLLAWDENAFTAQLQYDAQSAEDAAEIIRLVRLQVGRILRLQPDSAFSRTGTHSQAGAISLADVVRKANAHLDHHLKFIHEKREAMGKLMW